MIIQQTNNAEKADNGRNNNSTAESFSNHTNSTGAVSSDETNEHTIFWAKDIDYFDP